jgi:hypothetical protein
MLRALCFSAMTLAVVLSFTIDARLVAHRTAVSPYTFHRDVLPILEAHCGRCHQDNGVSGVSLLRYETARAVTWPMRQALAAGHMPPWFAEGAFKAPARLTARELNMLLTWATGGAPEGRPQPRNARPSPPAWSLGQPDVVLPMPSAFTMADDRREFVHEVELPSRRIRGRLIRAVDLRPGTPGMVRQAEIMFRTGARTEMLGLWQAGEEAMSLEGAAVQVPRNASLVLRIHYQNRDARPIADRSELGVYFAAAGAKPLRAIEVAAEAARETILPVDRRSLAVAIRPITGPSGAWIRISVIEGNGSRKDLARIQLREGWERRYVFETPVLLEPQSRMAVSVIPSEGGLWASLTGQPVASSSSARIAIEVIN